MLSERSMAQSLLACMGLPRRKGSTCDRCPSRGQPGTTGGKRRQKRGHEYRNWRDASWRFTKQGVQTRWEDIIMYLSLQLQLSLGKSSDCSVCVPDKTPTSRSLMQTKGALLHARARSTGGGERR